MAAFVTGTVIQRRINDAVVNGRGRLIQFPISEKEIELTTPLDVPPHAWGPRLLGQSRHWTHFHARFDPTLPPEDRAMFRLTNTRDFSAGHFTVSGEGVAAVATHRSLVGREDNSLMTAPTWHDIDVQGWTGIESGFVHTARPFAGDAAKGLRTSWQNDEHGNYRDVRGLALAGSLFVFAHAQSKEHALERCAWNDCGGYGVDATGSGYWGYSTKEAANEAREGDPPERGGEPSSEPRRWGGTFHATNCRGGGSGVAEYGLGRPSGHVRITYPEHENVRRLVESLPGVASTNAQPVAIESPRVAFSRLPEDGFGISLLNGGPLAVRGPGIFGEGGPVPRIYHGASGGVTTVVEGVHFGAPGARDVFPVVQDRVGRGGRGSPAFNGRLVLRGNTYAGREFGSWTVPGFEVDEVYDGILEG